MNQTGETYLERILTREALVAVAAREWLDCQMNSLMPLQIVISVEALRALVASEWPVVLRIWRWVTVHVVHRRSVPTVVPAHHPMRDTAH